MAKHKVIVTLTGHFYIDDESLVDYDAKTIAQALVNQLNWLEDEGDYISFFADTIQEPILQFELDK
jgi:hypothetical protein